MYSLENCTRLIAHQKKQIDIHKRDKLEAIKESDRRVADMKNVDLTTPRPVFRNNKKKSKSKKRGEQMATPQNEYLVEFIGNSWNDLVDQLPIEEANKTFGKNELKKKKPEKVIEETNVSGDGSGDATSGKPTNAKGSDKDKSIESTATTDNSTAEKKSKEKTPTANVAVRDEPLSELLENFQPFNFDEFWSERLFNDITKSA